MHPSRTGSRILAAAAAALCFALQACAATPTESVTVDDLLGDLDVFLSSSVKTSALASASGAPGTNAAADLTEPSPNQISVPSPGTPTVFTWPVIQDLPITARRRSTGEIVLGWPSLSPSSWPDLFSGPGDANGNPALHFGNAWMIYHNDQTWVAETAEWLRSPGERTGTVFHPNDKLTAGFPDSDDPVAFFVAGPSRFEPDLPEYRRRTEPKWFLWGSLTPFQWPSTGPPPPPPPPPPAPTLEEVHVYILAFSTELDSGTKIDFSVEIGDVDLMSLRGQTRQVVDAQVPRGTFKHISFTIDSARSFVVVGGQQQPLNVPNRVVRVDGPYIVDPTVITAVTLEFNPEQSLIIEADGSYTLRPFVKILVGNG